MAKSKKIPAPVVPVAGKEVRFSFKHLDENHAKFPIAACKGEFWEHLIRALRRYSGFPIDQFMDNNNDDHRHSFELSEEFKGSWLTDAPEELRGELPWSFALCPEIHAEPHSGWRVVGFIIDDVFYVVWFDPEHRVFPDKSSIS